MELGIIGFPRSGKTTVFCALTGSATQLKPSFGGKVEPHLGVVKVADPRLDQLAPLFNPEKIVYATLQLVDVPGITHEAEGGKSKGLPEAMTLALGRADALMAVIRVFNSPEEGPADPEKEIGELDTELIISDLIKVENRLERLDKTIKKVAGPERQQAEIEQVIMLRAKETLEKNLPLRTLELRPEEQKMIKGFQFLSQKPMLYLLNIDEKTQMGKTEEEILAPFEKLRGTNSLLGCLCAQIEMEIASLPPEERKQFLIDYSIKEPAVDKIIHLCYRVLGYISFITCGEMEVRAWPIPAGFNAQEAAGAIHTDLQTGFVRAEVIHWDDLLSMGGYGEARKKGLLRTEGKSYIVKDGDTMHILHSK